MSAWEESERKQADLCDETQTCLRLIARTPIYAPSLSSFLVTFSSISLVSLVSSFIFSFLFFPSVSRFVSCFVFSPCHALLCSPLLAFLSPLCWFGLIYFESVLLFFCTLASTEHTLPPFGRNYCLVYCCVAVFYFLCLFLRARYSLRGL